MRKNNKEIINQSLCSPVKREKVPKKDKNAFVNYLNWKKYFMYFSHFIAKQGTVFKDICFEQGTQFCSACSSISLIYYGPANWSFRRQIPRANYFIIIIYYEVFLYFFSLSISPKNCLFVCCFFLRSGVRKPEGI